MKNNQSERKEREERKPQTKPVRSSPKMASSRKRNIPPNMMRVHKYRRTTNGIPYHPKYVITKMANPQGILCEKRGSNWQISGPTRIIQKFPKTLPKSVLKPKLRKTNGNRPAELTIKSKRKSKTKAKGKNLPSNPPNKNTLTKKLEKGPEKPLNGHFSVQEEKISQLEQILGLKKSPPVDRTLPPKEIKKIIQDRLVNLKGKFEELESLKENLS